MKHSNGLSAAVGIVAGLLTCISLIFAMSSHPSVFVTNAPYDECPVFGVQAQIHNQPNREQAVLNPDLVIISPSRAEINLTVTSELGTLNVSPPRRVSMQGASDVYFVSIRGKLGYPEAILIRFCSDEETRATVYLMGDNYSRGNSWRRMDLTVDASYNFGELASAYLDFMTPFFIAIVVGVALWVGLREA